MPTRRPFFLLKAIDNALEILTKLNIIQTTHYHERTTSPNLDNPSSYQKKHLYFFSLQIPLTFHNKYLELISTHFYQALNNTWAVLFLSKFFYSKIYHTLNASNNLNSSTVFALIHLFTLLVINKNASIIVTQFCQNHHIQSKDLPMLTLMDKFSIGYKGACAIYEEKGKLEESRIHYLNQQMARFFKLGNLDNIPDDMTDTIHTYIFSLLGFIQQIAQKAAPCIYVKNQKN